MRRLRFECNSLLYLNRRLPGSAVYDLSAARQLLLCPIWLPHSRREEVSNNRSMN
jgi:hypothetical protein